jgi:hypothetical protein
MYVALFSCRPDGPGKQIGPLHQIFFQVDDCADIGPYDQRVVGVILRQVFVRIKTLVLVDSIPEPYAIALRRFLRVISGRSTTRDQSQDGRKPPSGLPHPA